MLINFRRVGGIPEHVNDQALENHRWLQARKGSISGWKCLRAVSGRQTLSPNSLVKITFDWINRSTSYRQTLRFSELKLGNLIPQCCRVSLRGNRRSFLAGYGAAQAVPGPLFTFSAYLGTVVNTTPHGLAGAALGLVGIFLPGVLILLGTLPFWDTFRKRAFAQAMMRGVNAAVVGLLGAALYNLVWT